MKKAEAKFDFPIPFSPYTRIKFLGIPFRSDKLNSILPKDLKFFNFIYSNMFFSSDVYFTIKSALVNKNYDAVIEKITKIHTKHLVMSGVL